METSPWCVQNDGWTFQTELVVHLTTAAFVVEMTRSSTVDVDARVLSVIRNAWNESCQLLENSPRRRNQIQLRYQNAQLTKGEEQMIAHQLVHRWKVCGTNVVDDGFPGSKSFDKVARGMLNTYENKPDHESIRRVLQASRVFASKSIDEDIRHHAATVPGATQVFYNAANSYYTYGETKDIRCHLCKDMERITDKYKQMISRSYDEFVRTTGNINNIAAPQ